MNENTKFGFDFGSMEVTRTHGNKFASVISVKTPKARFSVRATKTGNIRFYDDQGNECELVNKDFMKSIR